MAQEWDKIFEKRGKYLIEPQKDMMRVVKAFKKKKVKKVLDLGCGSGRHTVFLAKHGFDVYSFDISKHGIKLAKDWLKEEGLKAHFAIGSIYRKLPYKENFFDAVVSVRVIHHGRVEEIKKLIKEMERVLKPGGLLFIEVTKPAKTNIKSKEIAPRTYLSLEGKEKGAIHYIYSKALLRKDFKDFNIRNIWYDSSTKKHFCLLGELETK